MTIHTVPTTRASAAPAPSLEVLAARLVRAGREAAAAAHDCAAGSAVGQWRQVRDWLAPLAERQPLDDLDDDALVAALGVVGRDLDAEGAGTERRVVDTTGTTTAPATTSGPRCRRTPSEANGSWRSSASCARSRPCTSKCSTGWRPPGPCGTSPAAGTGPVPEPDRRRGREAAEMRRLAEDLTDVELWLEWRLGARAALAVRGLGGWHLTHLGLDLARGDPGPRRRAAEDAARALEALGYTVARPRGLDVVGLLDGAARDADAHRRMAAVARIEAALAAAGVRLPSPRSGEE